MRNVDCFLSLSFAFYTHIHQVQFLLHLVLLYSRFRFSPDTCLYQIKYGFQCKIGSHIWFFFFFTAKTSPTSIYLLIGKFGGWPLAAWAQFGQKSCIFHSTCCVSRSMTRASHSCPYLGLGFDPVRIRLIAPQIMLIIGLANFIVELPHL